MLYLLLILLTSSCSLLHSSETKKDRPTWIPIKNNFPNEITLYHLSYGKEKLQKAKLLPNSFKYISAQLPQNIFIQHQDENILFGLKKEDQSLKKKGQVLLIQGNSTRTKKENLWKTALVNKNIEN